MSGAGPDAEAALTENDRRLGALIATAERHFAHGRYEAAAAGAQVAAQFAWMNHAGRFASAELEDLLGRLAARCGGGDDGGSARPPREDPADVIHVLTQCYPTGGSTREVVRWMEQDDLRRHRIVVTRQETVEMPAFVKESRAAGPPIRLDLRPGGILARARALRRVAATTDMVVLHVHPSDVVPVIAFAGGAPRPPVVLVNQADHVFWLGTSIADVVLHMRDSGRRLAEARRGIEPQRSVVMARPLRPNERVLRRDEARHQLGLDPDAVVLTTAADGSKYRAIGDEAFLDLVLPALRRHAHAVLVAAGPSDDGPWAAAATATGGRVRALGPVPDVATLHEASDVYLDSFPFSSLTSMLEAGSVGVPGITYRGHPEGCGVLGADVPGVDPYITAPTDPAAYDDALERAIVDPDWRASTGAATASAIRATHTGAGWRADVDTAYGRAAQLRAESGAPAPRSAPFGAERIDELVRDVMLQTPFARGVDGAVLGNLGLMPLPQRAAAAARLARGACRPAPRDLVSEWLRPPLADARRRYERARGRTPR